MVERPEPDSGPAHAIRVVKGRPNAEELAALTAVVLARAAAYGSERDDTAGKERVAANWRRIERRSGFLGPRTWRDGTSVTPPA